MSNEAVIMRKFVIIIILLGTTGILVGPARADIVNIDCALWPEGHTFSWSFDYDLQKLTISQTLYYLEYDLDPDPWWSYGTSSLGVGGLADSASTFSVELTITNETGIEWIGYELKNNRPATMVLGGAYIIPGSIETTKLQTITDIPPGGWLLSEPPAVFDGESFTMRFDMRTCETANSKGPFRYYVEQIPVYVPEPAAIALLGVGGMALLKKHKQTFLPPLRSQNDLDV
jgi:hypothetical protein